MKPRFWLLAFILCCVRRDTAAQVPTVQTGIDVLRVQNFAPLSNKRVGLITNQTGIASDGITTIDVLAKANRVTLVSLFAPEHGLKGRVLAGKQVGNSRDAVTKLPIYSLYGSTRKPTKTMLKGVTALVYDIQDVGVRSYTYISTLGLCMEAAAENNIPFFVLDRPNPLGGVTLEGNLPSAAFRSFIGKYPIPYRHGLTVGELARMINGKGWLKGGKRCRLTVISMRGWKREMPWAETGLRWTATSPNVPYSTTPFFLAATGIAGEAGLDIGAGTTKPFERVGLPGLDNTALHSALRSSNMPNVAVSPATWRTNPTEESTGVDFAWTTPNPNNVTRLNFEIVAAIRRTFPEKPLFVGNRARMFDLACGTDTVRKSLLRSETAASVWQKWTAGSQAFASARRPFLLY